MNGHVTPSGLFVPGERKKDGGTVFDDELEPVAKVYAEAIKEMVAHLNERPDHALYVGSAEERTKMREVLNWWMREGHIGHNPNIRIDYGIPEGQIRIGE